VITAFRRSDKLWTTRCPERAYVLQGIVTVAALGL
jgi:hypothetical protein